MSAETGRSTRFLLLPALLLLGVLVAWPVLRVIQLSFQDVELAGRWTPSWVGLDQHARLWQDGRWWTALRNTLVFTSASVLLEMLLGVSLAFVLHRRFRGRGLARAAVMLPWALPTAVMALAWAWIFNDSFGVANDLLRRLGLMGTPLAWLAHPWTAMAALVIADVWKTTPFVMLIALAGLQSVPDSVIEAARIDGLSTWQRTRHVTLPLIAPALLVAFAFRLIQAYGAFDLVYVMTGGGPGGTTETISLYAFQNYFRYLDFGFGSAVAVQGALIVAGGIGALLWLMRGAR